MKRHNNILLCMLCVLLAFTLLAGCGSPPALPKGMDAEVVKDKALEVMDNVNAKNYDAIVFRDDFGSPTADVWETQLDPVWEKLGDFKEYEGVEVQGQTQDGIEYGVAMVACKYANGKITWAVSFDTSYNLIGVVVAG